MLTFELVCIASLIQIDKKRILTFSRDEDPKRNFEAPEFRGNALYPRDLLAGGTWIAYQKGIVYTLQNGALSAHQRLRHYDRSRGGFIIDLINGMTIEELFDSVEGVAVIEPFTLGVLDFKQSYFNYYYCDGNKHVKRNVKLNKQYLNFSYTLYDEYNQNRIRSEFSSENFLNPEDLLDFHKGHVINGKYGIRHTAVASTSITQFVFEGDKMTCTFLDLLKNTSSGFQRSFSED